MQFVTPYTHISAPGERNEGPEIVEKTGYIPTKQQIETYMLAGKRLAAYRATQGEYDFNPGQPIDEDFVDITRNPGFDLADASQAAQALEPRLQEQQQASEAALKAEADAKALEEAKALVDAYNKAQGETPQA